MLPKSFFKGTSIEPVLNSRWKHGGGYKKEKHETILDASCCFIGLYEYTININIFSENESILSLAFCFAVPIS